ncbi:leucine-rich repeat-containing protein 46 [Echinops telfairi]|uniref:Leucine-rich repeat-containing protein 46 n=1 Tax=Echinops telfairi TaxID=9371 RepID=A0ABM1VMN0_ECHTE|nr:leucine-rich repeat-containing protein 46 [Echinops telfairi]
MPETKLAVGAEEKGLCVTEALITKRNLTFPEDDDLSEKMFHTLAELQTVRLDRERITFIRNLESLRSIHSLYLQSNKIQRIENLACIPSLRFLSLAGNRIKQVENLLVLPHLQFLDLSDNLIETLKLDEFPLSLLILNLTGNGCTKQKDYRKLVIRGLPLLLDLDQQPVQERWVSDEEGAGASGGEDDDDDEYPELSGPFCSERGFLKGLEQELSRHRERRQQAALMEHCQRMEAQLVLTDLPPLPEEPMAAGDSSPPDPPGQGKKTPTETTSSPQTHTATKPYTRTAQGQQGAAQARPGARGATAPKASLPGAPSTSKSKTQKIKK